jgi:hypothetical protein
VTDDNVTDIRAHRLADLIMAEWLDSQSDSGAIWLKSHQALQIAKEENSAEIFAEAVEIARDRFLRMHNR